MTAMEDFGESEPKELIVIYTNDAGDLCWSSTTDSNVVKLGLIESCKQYLIFKMKEGA